VDPAKIQGTGKNGRILKSDVMAYLDAREARQDEDIKAAAPAPGPDDTRQEKRVPMTRLRARIAERLVEAQANAAILTTFNEVNLKPVMDLRARHKDAFEKAHDVRLGFMSFFVKAAVEALKRFPVVNASVDGSDIVYHNYFDIGVAVSSPRGLVVPILRNVDQMSFAEIEGTIKAFGQKAQDGSLTYDDLTGGTFTISNGGVFGSMLSTPILNPPQSAILGMHNIVERPLVENGEIVIRPVMYLALSYDHRIIDGREAVQSLVTIKQCLEDPGRMLLGI
jgi:2-oxoglutarate dehydrogenase E2 component (dihydrolipoamide succinyltransferase)